MRPLLLAAILLATPATAQDDVQLPATLDDLMADCIEPYADLRIAGCTRAIESGVWQGADAAWAYNNRAVAWRHLGEWQKALDDFSIAIGLDPENPINWNNRGHALRLMGRAEESLVHFEWAIELDPTYRLAWLNRAAAYAALGRDAEAVADYSEAIRLDAAFFWPFNDRGLAHHRLGAFDAALDDFAAALAIRPGDPAALNNRANTLCRLGRAEEALAGWAAAMAADPGFAAREQDWLRRQGFYSGPETGAFDAATAEAQRAYAAAGCPGA